MSMKVRKPAKTIEYPPRVPPPRDHHDYSTGENWQKIADRFGLSVWDLIYYNFQCRNPEEVNWCMREFFGCTSSNDGKNYSFSTSDRNRRVFVPPTWFRSPFLVTDNAYVPYQPNTEVQFDAPSTLQFLFNGAFAERDDF